MQSEPETAAMVRTSYALTRLKGSKAPNVIPLAAKATVNVRIDPSESVDIVFGRLKSCLGADSSHAGATVACSLAKAIEPSPISHFDDETFAFLRRVVHSVYPDAAIAPYVQSSASDARHFARICPHTYRFAGFLFRGDQRRSIHGQDENLDVESYRRGVMFYVQLIRSLEQFRG
jgi:carboxypeptidase PM20D1